MACKRQSKTNKKQPSILFDTLYKISDQNEKEAALLYAYFQQDVFVEDFGDWIKDSKLPLEERTIHPRKVDENGEPLLTLDKKYGSYYYTNKNNRKVYYPIEQGRLKELYSSDSKRSITKLLAINFAKERLTDNFEEVDLSERNITLRESIIAKLKSKVKELQADGHVINAAGLNQSLAYTHEWVKSVEDYFSEIKLTYVEEENEEAETPRGQTFGKSSFEKSYKANVSANVKLRLSLLTDLKNLDPMFFEPELKSFDSVMGDLMSVLTDQTAIENENGVEDIFDLYKNNIENLSHKKPYLKDLVRMLNSPDISESIKAEFVQTFRLAKNNFIGTVYSSSEYVNAEDEVSYSVSSNVQNLSDVGSKNKFVRSQWHYYFAQKFVDKEDNYSAESLQKLGEIKQAFNVFQTDFKDKLKNGVYSSNEAMAPAVDNVLEILSSLGIRDVNVAAFNHYLDGLDSLDPGIDQRVENLDKLVNATEYFLTALIGKEINLGKTNPFDNQGEFIKLAKAEAFYLNEGSDASIYTAGKSKWIYSYVSYLGNKIKQWKKDPKSLETHYNQSVFNEGSHYMSQLLGHDVENNRELESADRLENFELAVFNSLQERGGQVVDNKGMAKDDAFLDIYNKMLGFRKGDKSYISTPTPADKSMQYQFSLPKALMVSGNARIVDGVIKVNEEVKEIIFKQVMSEHNRMKQVQKEINTADKTGDRSKLKSYYHLGPQNGLKFQMFPSLNFDTLKKEEKKFALYTKTGKVLTTVKLDYTDKEGNQPIKDKIFEKIESSLNIEIQRVQTQLFDLGMITVDNTGKTINKGFDSRIWESYQAEENVAIKVAGDIYINGLIGQVEFSKMFAGDPAYYKDMVDYKKRIPGTYIDGLELYLRPGEENFNIAVIEDVEIRTQYLDSLKEIVSEEVWSQYENIDSTDAQAWITPTRWKFLKERLGKWSKADDVVYAKMLGKNTEVFTPEELKRAAQPLKGVYFEINEGAPVYLKYSQAVLLPNLIAGTQLETLYKKMDKDGIDEVVTFQGIKVGANEPTRIHNEDGTIMADFDLNPMQLKNSGWKLQQDLPTKTFGPTDVGSQIQKNIYSGISYNLNGDYLLQGAEIKGTALIDHLNNVVKHLSNKGLERFTNEFKIDESGKITNLDKLNESIVKQLKDNGAPLNIIEALENGVSPFGIPGYQEKIQHVFASIALKRIVKIKTNGGSFIQMSSFGLNNDEANAKGVKWTPWAEKTAQEYSYLRDTEGKKILSPSGKPIIKAAGVLISGSLIAKYVPDYAKMSSTDLFGTLNEETGKYENGLIDEKILNNIIGYRIPNQLLASNEALQVVGILPEESGDTVVAYTGITKKTGSDFDIDKMYLMIPSFSALHSKSNYAKARRWAKALDLTEEELLEELYAEGIDPALNADKARMEDLLVEEVLMNFDSESTLRSDYESEAGIGKVIGLEYVDPTGPVEEMSLKQLQNSLIESYKAVLTNPDIIEEVLTPVDSTFMKNDIVFLNPKEETRDLKDFNVIDEVNQKYEFLAGVAGVGQSANAGVDLVRGTMATLGFRNYYLGLGEFAATKNGGRSTIFDRKEYSEQLSDRDFKEYIADYNAAVEKDPSKDELDKLSFLRDKKNLSRIKLTHGISAAMNGFVDIARDPFITRGNWTTQTSNVGFMLVRAGVHPFRINSILAQPIIKEYVNFVTHSESILSNNSGDLFEKFIDKKVGETLGEAKTTINGITMLNRKVFELSKRTSVARIAKIFDVADLDPELQALMTVINDAQKAFKEVEPFEFDRLSLKETRDAITENRGTDQIAMAKTFFLWQEQSKKLVENINASKLDVNGYGKNPSTLLINKNLINKLTKSKLSKGALTGFKTKLNRNGSVTLLGAYKDNIIDRLEDIMQANPTYFLTANESIQNTFNEISKGMYGENLKSEVVADKIERSFYSYVMSGLPALQLSIEQKKELRDELPQEIAKAKKKYADNLLLQNLEPKVGQNKVLYYAMSNRKKSPSLEADIINAWEDLTDLEPELSNKLAQYAYLTSGFQLSINQFYNYIPSKWFIDNNVNDYINDVALDYSKTKKVDKVFIDSFFRHSMDDYQLVPNIYEVKKGWQSATDGFIKAAPEKGVERTHDKTWVKRTKWDSDPQGNDVSFTELYELEGYDAGGNAVYVRKTPLGMTDSKGNKIYEYDYKSDRFNSIVDTNTAYKINPKTVALLRSKIVKKRAILIDKDEAQDVEGAVSIPTEKTSTVDLLEIGTPVLKVNFPVLTDAVSSDAMIAIKKNITKLEAESKKLDNLIKCIWTS